MDSTTCIFCDLMSFNTPNTPQKSLLWFEDGTVVIKAERTLFRVHADVISSASTILRDRLKEELAQSDDGCPLLEVDDCQYDFLIFLQAIYFTEPYCLSDPVTISTLQRLGKKYDALAMVYLAEKSIAELPRLVTLLSALLRVDASRSLSSPTWDVGLFGEIETDDEVETTMNKLVLLTSTEEGARTLESLKAFLASMAETEQVSKELTFDEPRSMEGLEFLSSVSTF